MKSSVHGTAQLASYEETNARNEFDNDGAFRSSR